MRTKLLAIMITMLAITLSTPLLAGPWTGTIKLGGIFLDEEGDLSTVQETYNIHDGFSISQIRLVGTPGTDNFFMLNLKEINLDGRRGDFLFRRSGTLRLNGSFDQHRQVFDPQRSVLSERKDWNFGIGLTPAKWLRLAGHLNTLTRTGDRVAFPSNTPSVLGSRYDHTLTTGKVSAEARKDGRGIAVDYRTSDFTDDLNADQDRTGKVVSARVYTPYRGMTHMLRTSYGTSELTQGGLDYTLSTFQYTGIVRPGKKLQFKYNFGAQRVDNTGTEIKTDRIQNNFDATYYLPHGSLTAGYGHETNDDDRRLTSYNSWRLAATMRSQKVIAKVHYAGRVKKDTEELTLLKDVEASRLRGNLEFKAKDNLTLTAGFNLREREFPDIKVKSEGQSFRAGIRHSCPSWGSLSSTYTYSNDEYTDIVAGFHATTHIVTGRIDFERIKNLRLSSGLTYMDAGEDLDIEKSILFFEGMYTVRDDIHLEVKYNIYNYDDFILIDRYYTANVVWFNIAYDLHLE